MVTALSSNMDGSSNAPSLLSVSLDVLAFFDWCDGLGVDVAAPPMDDLFSFKAMALAMEHSTPRVLFLSGSGKGAGGASNEGCLWVTILRLMEPKNNTVFVKISNT